MHGFVADGNQRYAQALQNELQATTRELRRNLAEAIDAAEREAIETELAQVARQYDERRKLIRYGLF